MTRYELMSAFANFEFAADQRETEDIHKLASFRRGWRDASLDRKTYGTSLSSLTWQNAGYRLGLHFGEVSDGEIDWAFDLLARQPAAETNHEETE